MSETLSRTRGTDDDTSGVKIPWWISVGLRALKEVGFPIVVAGFLLWHYHTTGKALEQLMSRALPLLEKLELKLDREAKP